MLRQAAAWHARDSSWLLISRRTANTSRSNVPKKVAPTPFYARTSESILKDALIAWSSARLVGVMSGYPRWK